MGRNKEKLYPVTVRFSESAWKAIRDMSDDNGISQAELVRMAVAGNLERYLGGLRIIDKYDSYEIRKAVVNLFNATCDLRNELRRIGVNYNQEVRALNIAVKSGKGTAGRGSKYPKSEVDRVLERYESAVRQAGDILCRILT